MRDYKKLRIAAHAVIDEVWCPACGYDSVWGLQKVLAETPQDSELERLMEWLDAEGQKTLALIVERERQGEVSTAWLSGQLAGLSQVDEHIHAEFGYGEE